jgi:hypothetical protein
MAMLAIAIPEVDFMAQNAATKANDAVLEVNHEVYLCFTRRVLGCLHTFNNTFYNNPCNA